MKTQINQTSWGLRSISYWITFLLALGIIFIGARFIIQPQLGANGFGIAFTNEHDSFTARSKASGTFFRAWFYCLCYICVCKRQLPGYSP